MFSRIPIVACPLRIKEIGSARARDPEKNRDDFSAVLADYISASSLWLTNSGTSALYLLLQALARQSGRREVIIPAYTAERVVAATQRAGLKPVLCDISLDDFNIDLQKILSRVTADTLAVVCVHMFGIPVKGIETFTTALPKEVFLIEDSCQALGSKVETRHVGSFSGAAIFSFNRGKNIPLYGGGAVAVHSSPLNAKVDELAKKYLKRPGSLKESVLAAKLLALSLCVRPFVYGVFSPVLSWFKEQSPPEDILVEGITGLQAGLGIELFRRIDEFSRRRNENGMFLVKELRGIEAIRLPQIPAHSFPAFNRFPVMVSDEKKKQEIEKKMGNIGIETSPMYRIPLHHFLDLGYTREEFPQANFFARSLVTLPVHPLVSCDTLAQMVQVVRSVFQ
ncbi:MAG: DegT/DnrJ/EryC1/StrS family aminotransferase [Candidatus Omnitrophica bacterium]|nr:DegT/DnrJ/EryC1/StrS family aminotransferase [Candidatus Omnitrophota bacterium]